MQLLSKQQIEGKRNIQIVDKLKVHTEIQDLLRKIPLLKEEYEEKKSYYASLITQEYESFQQNKAYLDKAIRILEEKKRQALEPIDKELEQLSKRQEELKLYEKDATELIKVSVRKQRESEEKERRAKEESVKAKRDKKDAQEAEKKLEEKKRLFDLEESERLKRIQDKENKLEARLGEYTALQDDLVNRELIIKAEKDFIEKSKKDNIKTLKLIASREARLKAVYKKIYGTVTPRSES